MRASRTPSPRAHSPVVDRVSENLEKVGRAAVAGVSEVGFGAVLFAQSIFWTLMGHRRAQPVRLKIVFDRCMEVGIAAIPIVTMMSITIGMMLAIQGIYTLATFGAEQQVTIGVGISVVREFGPLITVRFIVTPALIAMVIMVPVLTFWADLVMLAGAGWYISVELGISMGAYIESLQDIIKVEDVTHGLGQSVLFGVLITLVGVINGALVEGGAEGVGRMTTRSVVLAISAIIVTDMIFAFITTR
jgi:phospholipid/cholesterol/gamma-HCH transport system permease protein